MVAQAGEQVLQRVQSAAESAGTSQPISGFSAPELTPSATTRLGCSRCRNNPKGCLSCHPDWAAVRAAKREVARLAKLAKANRTLQRPHQSGGEGSGYESRQSTPVADVKSSVSFVSGDDDGGQASAVAEHRSCGEAPDQPTPPPSPSSEVHGRDAMAGAEAEALEPASEPQPVDEAVSAAELQSPPLPPDEDVIYAALQALPLSTDDHVLAPESQPLADEGSLQPAATVSLSTDDFAALQEVLAQLGSANLGLSPEGTAAVQHVVAQRDGAQTGASVLLLPIDHANITQLVAQLSSGQLCSAQHQHGSQSHPRPQRMFSVAAGQGQSPAKQVQPPTVPSGLAQQPSSPRPAGVFSATTPYSLSRPDGTPTVQTHATSDVDGHQHRPLRGLHPDHRPWGKAAAAALLSSRGGITPLSGDVDVPGLDFDPAVDVPKVQQPAPNTTRIGGPPTLRVPSASRIVRGSGHTARRGGGRGAPQRTASGLPTVSASVPAAQLIGTQTAPAPHAAPGQPPDVPTVDQHAPGPLSQSAVAGATTLDAQLPGLKPVPHEGLEAVKKLLLPLRKLKLLAAIDAELYRASKSAGACANAVAVLMDMNANQISTMAASVKTQRSS